MDKRKRAPWRRTNDVMDQIIDALPSEHDTVKIDTDAVEKFVGALQEFIAIVQPAIRRRAGKDEALRLSKGRMGTTDWLERVVADTRSR